MSSNSNDYKPFQTNTGDWNLPGSTAFGIHQARTGQASSPQLPNENAESHYNRQSAYNHEKKSGS